MISDTYDKAELEKMGMEIGQNVRIHKTVLFFGTNIFIGNNVRIDCYSIITSNKAVILGDYIHIGAGTHIFGTEGIAIDDYCNISSRCSIFTKSDDFTDGYMTNPTVPEKFKKVYAAPVHLQKHVIIGCGSIILPGVTLHEGASVGALSLVNKNVESYSIAAGIPIHETGKRDKRQLSKIEKAFQES